MRGIALTFLFALVGITPAMTERVWAEGVLAFPLACTLGQDCFIQQLADLDPGPGTRDPYCGTASYDGHQGADFRVPRDSDLTRAVAVLAVADGRVVAVRDGTPDGTRRAGENCGNGIVLSHANGLESQYCHLKQGSITVAPGDRVTSGQPMAAMGLTGNTEFAHLHLTFRRDGTVIDPFTGRTAQEGCGAPLAPLWRDSAALPAGESLTTIMEIGLAGAPLTMEALEAAIPAAPTAADGALIAYVWALNLAEGDRMVLRLRSQDGAVLFQAASEPYARAKAQAMFFTGRRMTPPGGPYILEAAITRADHVIARRREERR